MYVNPYSNNGRDGKKKSDPKNNGIGMLISCIFIGLGLVAKHLKEILHGAEALFRLDRRVSKQNGFDEIGKVFTEGIPITMSELVTGLALLMVLLSVILVLYRKHRGRGHDTFCSREKEQTIHHNLDLAKQTGKINLNGRLYTKEELKQFHL